jgi:predicted TPR repeat methyltransferase
MTDKNQRIKAAIKSYEQAFAEGNKGLEAHLALAQLYTSQARMNDALLQYDAALKLDPASVITHYQLGVHFLRMQSFEWAKIQFKNVLALHAQHVDAKFHLGVCHLHLNDADEAALCFQEVIKLDPDYLEAWVNLGAIDLKKEQGQAAIEHFTHALTLNPEHEAARSNLAATFMHYARHENALTHYLILLDAAPNNLDYLYNAGVAEMTLGQLESAKARFLEILKHQPKHFETLYNLAVLYLRDGQKSKAKTWLAQASSLKPADPSCQHLLKALSGDASSSEVSAQYAQCLFDQYASYYDQHLLTTLHYRLPAMIGALLQTAGLKPQTNTLDLGCGTGLCGEILRPFTQHLVGVDVSPNMIERAKTKGCYDACVVQEAIAYLQQTTVKFDLVVAADLFPYLGSLEACFAGVKHCLRPGGAFIFSVEVTEAAPWQLQETARYAHQPAYIKSLCEKMGWEIRSEEVKVARDQAGGGIAVKLYLVM